jgi:hypothetical protein
MLLLSNQPDAVIHDLKRRKVVTSVRTCPDRPIMKQCNLSTILAARYRVTVQIPDNASQRVSLLSLKTEKFMLVIDLSVEEA